MPTGESLSLALGCSGRWAPEPGAQLGRLWEPDGGRLGCGGRPWGPGHHRDTGRGPSLRVSWGLGQPLGPTSSPGLPASNKHAAVRPQERSSDVRG